tara:strand:+ start:384 stop:1055 length:672 start_codon:yes stop_codon:yes gene_type:complete
MSSQILGALLVGAPAIIGAVNQYKANKDAEKYEKIKLENERKLKQLEAGRQAVLNQASDFRAMKSQLYNPSANLGVATQAMNLQMEQTDQALANTLDQINRSGTGAGAATALAKMAAASKASISANLEKQEVQNQNARIQGEFDLMQSQMALEEKALGAEVQAFGLQEARDVATLDRLAALQSNAEAQQFAYQQQGQQALSEGIGQTLDLGATIAQLAAQSEG